MLPGGLTDARRPRSLLDGLRRAARGATGTPARATDVCDCRVGFEATHDRDGGADPTLVLDASDCPGAGDLAAAPDCRATAVRALADRDADGVRTEARGRVRAYDARAAGFLLAAGRFVEGVAAHDPELAERACRDPLGVAREAVGRAGPVARLAAETGLAEGAAGTSDYAAALQSFVAPAVSETRIAGRPPPGAELLDRRELDTGAIVRRYAVPACEGVPADARDGATRDHGGVPYYALDPVEARFGDDAMAVLADAYGLLASGAVDGGDRAPGRAVRRVLARPPHDPGTLDASTETLVAVLHKHTRGEGVFEDLFADPRVSDAYATAPVESVPLRLTVEGDRHTTNATLTRPGAAALASRLRGASGRGFSRAEPMVDATIEAAGRRVRVAGVTAPASDGYGFAFRRHDSDPWTLARLVRNGTVDAGVAGFLSVAVERGAALLVAGPRGAGKTTALGALLWALPAETRTVAVEDTPELPVEALRAAGRDVQALRTDAGDGPEPTPAAALRTALRLGEGALVVGEVRGAEARVLYEAMRVGAGDAAVLGTIHGSGGAAVRDRVVNDLAVPESAFAATDLVVTLAADPHRVARVEELRPGEDGVTFATLFDESAAGCEDAGSTGTLDAGPLARGNSRVLGRLAGPGESYADVLARMRARAEQIHSRTVAGRTAPERCEDA